MRPGLLESVTQLNSHALGQCAGFFMLLLNKVVENPVRTLLVLDFIHA